MKYSQKQLRRFFHELGFDASLSGYEILLVALEIVMEKQELIYESNMDALYNLVMEKMPAYNSSKIRKNIENLINRWWENPKIEHKLKDRIKLNVNNNLGTRITLCYLRDELFSRDEI